MNGTRNNTRYLAVHPTTYGFGFAVFEEENVRLIDWGVYQAVGDKNQKSLLFLRRLIRRYEPQCVLLQARGPQERQRIRRIRRFLQAAKSYLRGNEIALKPIQRQRMKMFFDGYGAQTKHEIATRIVEWFPELTPYVPPKRKPWMPEDRRMGMFEAIALALTYFGVQDGVQKTPN